MLYFISAKRFGRRIDMSVIILGGNECMERQYKDLCREYKCHAKIFIKPSEDRT